MIGHGLRGGDSLTTDLTKETLDEVVNQRRRQQRSLETRERILQAAFEATPDLLSTEDFRIPYTLSGSVRAFNQALLEKDLIEEQLIFYTIERHRSMWRYFDARTYRSGALDRDYLVSLMDQLL